MIQRLFALLLSLQLQLFGAQYNATIIELEAKLFPKMLMLSTNKDRASASVEIVIISRECGVYNAKLFKKAIESNYKEGLMGKNLLVSVSTFEDIEGKPDGVIVLYHPKEKLISIAQWANERKIPSFAYDPAHLEYGFLASLYIGAQTKPYLNRATIKEYDFSINPHLLKLSKFF